MSDAARGDDGESAPLAKADAEDDGDNMGKQLQESTVPFHQTVVFAVTFYISTALVLVTVNKRVLLQVSAPIFFLWLQILVAVFLIYASDLSGVWKTPRKLDPKISYALAPLVLINCFGLTFNTLCLHFVDASLYQVARSLILPLTVTFSWIMLKKRSSVAVLSACGIVVVGFLVGTLLEDKEIKVSFWGVTFGVLSSVTTALHAIVIARSLEVVNNSTLDLVFYNNVLSAVGLVPIVLISGLWSEFAALSDMLGSGGLGTLVWGTLVTGLFGFLINLAGFLQIKVTSPVTHMISSAIRGVLQTILAVWFFGDVVTTQRIVGIVLILGGSSYYTYVRSIESEDEKLSKTESRV
ncbi:hypothetical protein DFJ74DRAFT_667458 [Hyaloraphidium curvatum]|nr:hypothetical protein DFJ74DRAFT_667458 [Hyaloraphidium curvatum]